MTPRERIDAYFLACSEGTPDEIAAHFTDDAVVWDTNIRPMRGAADIGASWVKVRERWEGARWLVDTCVTAPDEKTAAIEWQMTGTNPADAQPFVFRGSEHYSFADTDTDTTLIAEIRQYWTFDPKRLDTGLVGFDYSGWGADAELPDEAGA